jgi:hypothetical protein
VACTAELLRHQAVAVGRIGQVQRGVLSGIGSANIRRPTLSDSQETSAALVARPEA